ncbi:MAG: SPFH domain-containing protein [Deltaproteobacteria bacterium]|nr:SPFH domain-containing protein [Deltaproteobacteria bacterium]
MTATFYLAVFIGLTIYALYGLSRCLFQVSEGEIAVISAFGKSKFSNVSSKQLKVYAPGLHLKLPWECVQKVSMKEQILELSGDESGITAMTADGTTLAINAIVRITLAKDSLYQFIIGLEHPIDHLKSWFTCLLQDQIANFDQKLRTSVPSQGTLASSDDIKLGSYAVIRRERRLLNQGIQEFCRHQIGDRYGVSFDGIDLTDILPPDELAEALNSVINAHSEAQSLLARTEGECEQQVIAAAKGLDIAKARAQAVEQEISTMVDVLAKLQKDGTLSAYLERRRAEVYADARTSYIKRPS